MGFRTGFVIVSVAFLDGVLFITSIYDFPLLYSDYSSRDVDAAERFYLTLFNGPTAISALLHGMMGLGIVGLLAKIHRWSEMAKWFDGASLVLLMGSIGMYGGVQVPNIRLLSDPDNEGLVLRSSIRTQRENVIKARVDRGLMTLEEAEGTSLGYPLSGDERESALRILAAGNTIVMLLLAGVVLMQGAEWWLERSERIEADHRREKEMRELGVGVGSNNAAAAQSAGKSKAE